MSQIPWIPSEEVRRVLTWNLLIPAVQESLEAFSRGPSHPKGAIQPLRTTIPVEKYKGKLVSMPAYMAADERLSVKVATVFMENRSKNLPCIHAFITLLDGLTGKPIALVEGCSITQLRTAAASAVATKALASKNANIVAVIGAGTQGSAHARAMNFLLRPKEVIIWSRSEERCQVLVETLKKEGIPAVCSSSIEGAVKNADVINTCTLSSTPIVYKKWLKEGAHVNIIGACQPHLQELDPDILTSSEVFVDSEIGAFSESGDIIKSGVKTITEIGRYISEGNFDLIRTKNTVFKSLGLAVEDLVAASLVYNELNKPANA